MYTVLLLLGLMAMDFEGLGIMVLYGGLVLHLGFEHSVLPNGGMNIAHRQLPRCVGDDLTWKYEFNDMCITSRPIA